VSETLAGRYDLLIFDLDGVVYIGGEAVPRAVPALVRLREEGTAIAYATNNASRRAPVVAELLRGLGAPAEPADVVTAGEVTAAVLAARLPAGSPVLVVGTVALAAELADVGLRQVASADDKPAAVAQGYGPQVGWAQLAEGCVAVRAGAFWIATNADRTLPSPRGPLPGNGSLVAALATALDREPDLVVGKPAPALFEQTVERRDAARPLVVGDRLDTDIEGANRARMDSLFVLTGVHQAADLLAAPAARRPTYVAADLAGLFEPADAVPVDGAHAGWEAYPRGDELVLRGAGPPVGALRAVCAAAWRSRDPAGGPPRVRPDGAAAAEALATLGLARARAASGA
jgi:HAD superfamily hydrolase (TIGR01450 family)